MVIHKEEIDGMWAIIDRIWLIVGMVFSYPVNALHLMIYPRYVQKKQFISYLGFFFDFKKTLLALLCSPVCKGSQDSSHLGQLPPAIITVMQSLVPVQMEQQTHSNLLEICLTKTINKATLPLF